MRDGNNNMGFEVINYFHSSLIHYQKEKLDAWRLDAIKEITLCLNLNIFIFDRIAVYTDPEGFYNKGILEQRFYTLLSKYSKGLEELDKHLMRFTNEPIVNMCYSLTKACYMRTENLRQGIFPTELYTQPSISDFISPKDK